MATRKNAEPSEQKPEKQKPEKQKPEKQPKKAAGADAPQKGDAPQEADAPQEDALQKAAKAIGSALGTMAVKTGIAHPSATPPKKKIGKLIKKTKSRLPRKEKKLAKKNLAKSAG
jgi:hypothetical protein